MEEGTLFWIVAVALLLSVGVLVRGAARRCSGVRMETTAGQSVPAWFLPAGIIAVILAILAFLASAARFGGGDVAGSLLVGLLNPLFFIGMPLGIYWLYQFAQTGKRKPTITSEENNPRLTHCPDCGKHISRLATSCPHCGRPCTG